MRYGYKKCYRTINQSLLLNLLGQLWKVARKFPDVCSYRFVREIYQLYYQYGTDSTVFRDLISWLSADVSAGDGTFRHKARGEERCALDFAAYYLLALFCKRREATTNDNLSLGFLTQRFGGLLSDFTLSQEVYAWKERLGKQLDEAYKYDKHMISVLDIQTNAGVYASFASSVSQRLEKEYESQRRGESTYLWKDPQDRRRDWQQAVDYMPQVIELWKAVWESETGYGKHYFIYGKLLMYSPDLPTLAPADQKKRLDDAIRMFQSAKACENPIEANYQRRWNDYDKFERECGRMAAEITHQQSVPGSNSLDTLFSCGPATNEELYSAAAGAAGGHADSITALRQIVVRVSSEQIHWSSVGTVFVIGRPVKLSGKPDTMEFDPGLYVNCDGSWLTIIHMEDALVQGYLDQGGKSLKYLHLHRFARTEIDLTALTGLEGLDIRNSGALSRIHGLAQLPPLDHQTRLTSMKTTIHSTTM